MAQDNNKGFTLIELLLALVITFILIPSIFLIYVSSHRCYIMNESIIDMHQNARVSMEFMTRELKNAYFLEQVNSNTISFYTDTDNNTVIGTSTGGNQINTLNDTDRSWDPNGWGGVLLAITAGTGKGQVCEVSGNSPTQLRLSVDDDWDVTADDTSVYRLDVKKKGFSLIDDTLKYKKGKDNSPYYAFANNINDLCFIVDPTNDVIEITLEARSSLKAKIELKDPDDVYYTYNLKSIVITRN